jgi:hypothetical protein
VKDDPVKEVGDDPPKDEPEPVVKQPVEPTPVPKRKEAPRRGDTRTHWVGKKEAREFVEGPPRTWIQRNRKAVMKTYDERDRTPDYVELQAQKSDDGKGGKVLLRLYDGRSEVKFPKGRWHIPKNADAAPPEGTWQ